jgi:serine/threonine protein kinase
VDNAVSQRGGTTRLGSFEIVRKLARGGMAEIFLARTRGPSGFEKLVVLKKVLPKYAGKHRFVQLFLEEAKLAASLDHPNIAQVYDIGMVDGSYFFTMEYLHGQDVRSILHRTWRTRERFPIEHAVQIARHVASALHFAHEKQRGDGTLLGIVHRDVSPSNIIVTYDGATKLLDFGVAKSAASTVKTRTGALKGKIAYMSPEQARGAPLDRRSDIYSLGIVLWEMVTTQRLYRGENDLATLQMIINQKVKPPTTIRPDCPPELERIVMRALAEDLGKRYATAEQLVTDLDELAREHKLKQSPNALAATMSQLFSAELAAWREARAKGVQLADHLHDVRDMTTPVSESEFIDLDAILDEDQDDDDDDDDLDDEDELGGVEVDDEKTEHATLLVDPLTGEPIRPLRDSAPRLDPREAPGIATAMPTARELAAHPEIPGEDSGATGNALDDSSSRDFAARTEPAGEALRAGIATTRDFAPLGKPPGKFFSAAGNAIDPPTVRNLSSLSPSRLPLATEPMTPVDRDDPAIPRFAAESDSSDDDDLDGPTLLPGAIKAVLTSPDAPTLLPAPLVPSTHATPSSPFAPVTGRHVMPPAPPAPSGPPSLPGSPRPVTGKHALLSSPPTPAGPSGAPIPATGRHVMPPGPPGPPAPPGPPGAPGATGRHVLLPVPPATVPPGSPVPPGAIVPVTGMYATPNAPFPAVSQPPAPVGPATGAYATPSAPFPAADSPPPAPGGPATGRHAMPGAPFAVPPWQSGRHPTPHSDERTDRSWAVIDLPAFDPEAFARRRRLVFRIAIGLVGFILVLAILAGRC